MGKHSLNPTRTTGNTYEEICCRDGHLIHDLVKQYIWAPRWYASYDTVLGLSLSIREDGKFEVLSNTLHLQKIQLIRYLCEERVLLIAGPGNERERESNQSAEAQQQKHLL